MKNLLLGALLLLSTLVFTQNKIKVSYCNDKKNTITLYKPNLDEYGHTCNETPQVTYSIYDIGGKFIKKGFDNIIDNNELSYGVYILIIEIEGNLEITKIFRYEQPECTFKPCPST